LNFDSDAPGALPGSWRIEAANEFIPSATWQVVADKAAPTQPNTLALVAVNHASDDAANLCWTDKVRFDEGAVEVKFHLADGGRSKNAGLVWRAKDKDTYLLARIDAVQSSLRICYVKDGAAHDIDSHSLRLLPADWHTLRIEHRGLRITCSVDGVKRCEFKDDHSRAWGGTGGVGFWTCGDALASFDNLRVEHVLPAPKNVSPGPEIPDVDAKKKSAEERSKPAPAAPKP
jgi:hypothetical protein